MANGLKLRTALLCPNRPIEREIVSTLMVEISPFGALEKLPLNLGLLLDVSGSMAGEKLASTKEASKMLVERLKDSDICSIVKFSNSAETIFPPQQMNADAIKRAKSQIDTLTEEGATELLKGMKAVYAELSKNKGPGRTTFAILLSDGFPTDYQGELDENLSPYQDFTKQAFEQDGISLTTVGLGNPEEYNKDFLEKLADSGGSGRPYYSMTPSELVSKFEEELGFLKDVVLTDVRFNFNDVLGRVRSFRQVTPQVKIFDPPVVTGGKASVKLGSMQGSCPQAYLIDFITPPGKEGNQLLCSVEAEYPKEGAIEKNSENVLIRYTGDRAAISQENSEVRKLLDEFQIYRGTKEAEKAMKSGERRRATRLLQSAQKLTRRLGKSEATKRLENLTKKLEGGEEITEGDLAEAKVATKKTRTLTET